MHSMFTYVQGTAEKLQFSTDAVFPLNNKKFIIAIGNEFHSLMVFGNNFAVHVVADTKGWIRSSG